MPPTAPGGFHGERGGHCCAASYASTARASTSCTVSQRASGSGSPTRAVVLLRRSVGAQLAAVALPPVLRSVDERPGARRSRAGAEPVETVRLDDLDQRRRGRRAEMSGDRALLRAEAHSPAACGSLEARDGARVRGDLVQHARGLFHVAGVEDAAQSLAEALDLGEVALRR